MLGVFGREGLYLANYWGDGAGNGELPQYIKAAFRLYRNYDGKRGAFGDTAVRRAGAAGDLDKASIFAAADSKRPGTLTVLVINKELRTTFNGKIEITPEAKGGPNTKAQVFSFDASSAAVRPLADGGRHQQPDQLPPTAAVGYPLRLPPLSAGAVFFAYSSLFAGAVVMKQRGSIATGLLLWLLVATGAARAAWTSRWIRTRRPSMST